ncbi:MAG: hypothetical protein JJ971_01150 [Balneolaceae bacterium]|nr:hypothetical protein [Balneolaceae bacterium]MBO6544977.1 hypothetical protein [Balneolaceae bacterium]MBO6646373.1 hypothetical protein [Balneolaceae bacterium]
MYDVTVGHDPTNLYFNILHQVYCYRKKGRYVRYWLKELNSVPSEFIHTPHAIPSTNKSYMT